jgi:hypothetical protein
MAISVALERAHLHRAVGGLVEIVEADPIALADRIRTPIRIVTSEASKTLTR